MAARLEVPRVRLHAFTDGRDTSPKSALRFLAALEKPLARAKAKIATVSGRYYAMDRDKRWDRVARAYHALVSSSGLHAGSAEDAVREAYGRGETDEFIQPTVITEDGEPIGPVQDGDAVIFFNFRGPRGGSNAFTRRIAGSRPAARLTSSRSPSIAGVRPPGRLRAGEAAHIRRRSDAGCEHPLAETEKYARHLLLQRQRGAFTGEERILVRRGADHDSTQMTPRKITEEAVRAARPRRAGRELRQRTWSATRQLSRPSARSRRSATASVAWRRPAQPARPPDDSGPRQRG
jgi:bisphosphoglycerate-independent phosphoglycerate mutase (AlkP superfamily)